MKKRGKKSHDAVPLIKLLFQAQEQGHQVRIFHFFLVINSLFKAGVESGNFSTSTDLNHGKALAIFTQQTYKITTRIHS